MLQSAVIVFREVLEIALVLSVLAAATRGLPQRNRWLLTGVAGGIVASCVVAFFAGRIAEAAEGMGQELFNASVMLAAATLIGWTVIWMKQHGRHIAEHLRHVGKSVTEGDLPLYTLASVILLAVLREGSEIVLFSYGAVASGMPVSSILSGALLGLAGGIGIGLALYLGLVKISTRHLFSVTSWLLVFLAAGMSAQAAGFLVQSGHLAELSPALWDSSAFIADDSLTGQTLHALLGYTSQPSGMQMVFYLGTLLLLALGLQWTTPKKKPATA